MSQRIATGVLGKAILSEGIPKEPRYVTETMAFCLKVILLLMLKSKQTFLFTFCLRSTNNNSHFYGCIMESRGAQVAELLLT